MKARSTLAAISLVVLITAAFGAAAEVTVSVTLTGPMDEMLPILEQLRQAGFGPETAEDDALRLEMHSTITPEEGAAPDPAQPEAQPPAPQEPLQPEFAAFLAEPSVARAGDKVWLSILVLNGVGVVDTVSATLEATGEQIELYDNGEHGDPVDGDGQWSAEVVLSPDLQAGRHPLNIVAFNASGQPVKVNGPDGQPIDLTLQVALEVVR